MNEQFKMIGKRIKILRIQSGITHTSLAKELDTSQTNMSNIECDRVAVTMQNLLKIKGILNCKMADFFSNIDN